MVKIPRDEGFFIEKIFIYKNCRHCSQLQIQKVYKTEILNAQNLVKLYICQNNFLI